MNKKAFTLVELLAVIVIIGLISMITIPIVTELTSDAKQKTFDTNAKLMAKTAETYYIDNIGLLPTSIDGQAIVFLDALVSEYRDAFEPSIFIKLYNEDNLGGSISNVPVWLNETFSKLLKYK